MFNGAVYLDYSSGRPSGASVAAYPAEGVARYGGIGSSGKRLTAAEFADLAAHGRQVRMVAEKTTTDADAGYNAGVANARACEADRVTFGMSDSTIIYAANDKSSYTAADVDYVRGFRDVLGVRAGAYGFGSYLAAIYAEGYVVAGNYWQAGPAPSRTGTSGFVGLWQRQGGVVAASDGPTAPTTATIGGVVCDLNNKLMEAIVTSGVTWVASYPVGTQEADFLLNQAGVGAVLSADKSTVTVSIPAGGTPDIQGLWTINTDVRVAMLADRQLPAVLTAIAALSAAVAALDAKVTALTPTQLVDGPYYLTLDAPEGA